MSRTVTLIAVAVTVLFFSSPAMAVFTVGGTTYETKWYDDFDDGSIDAAKWPDSSQITESAVAPGTLTKSATTQTTTSANFGSEFTGATEWAYLFRVKVPYGQTWSGNRTGRVFVTPDISLYVFKWATSTTFAFWAGNSDYTSGTFYWTSAQYPVDTFVEVGIHREDGANQYDIFIDGTEVGSDQVSNTYSAGEVPATINFGSGSSVIAWGPVYDYMYAGMPSSTADLTIKKFFDCNGDNVKNGEDIDLAGWQFNITDGGSYNEDRTTDANGEINLTGLAPGDYTVTETVKGTGWILSGTNPRVVSVSGTTVANFGNQLPGDANQDEKVNLSDFTILKANFGSDPAGWTMGNFNTDTTVNLSDFTILKAYFGLGAPSAGGVPEPATMGLLALGAAALLRRRRKG